MAKKLLIILPVYNQAKLARRCLKSLAAQGWADFSILICDDQSAADQSKNYQELIKDFPSLEISYQRNEKNLGAIKNMINCLFNQATNDFIMCLHEDDFLHPDYLATALIILEKNKNLAFIGSGVKFFEPEKNQASVTNYFPKISATWQTYTPQTFTAFILNKNKFAFGSIIYRRELLRREFIDLATYDVLFDRPFLLKILIEQKKSAGLLTGQFYYYQNHPYPDKRWDTLKFPNILNLYSFYESLAPGQGRFITSQYFFDFINLKNKTRNDWRAFLNSGKKAKLFSGWRLSGKFILASLFILLFGKKYYYQLFTLIKNKR